jgi:hypothetical protein
MLRTYEQKGWVAVVNCPTEDSSLVLFTKYFCGDQMDEVEMGAV